MNWFLLVKSGCVELVFTFCLNKVSKTAGFEKGWWGIATASAIALSLYIVTKVLKTLPIGTAYAVWTGIGRIFKDTETSIQGDYHYLRYSMNEDVSDLMDDDNLYHL